MNWIDFIIGFLVGTFVGVGVILMILLIDEIKPDKE